MSAATPTQSDPSADLPRLLSAIAAAPKRDDDPITSISQWLPELCRASKATAGILWCPAGAGFRWQSSCGVELADAAPESEFTQDIVANAEQVCESGAADILVTPAPHADDEASGDHPNAATSASNSNHSESADATIRDLVLFHRQLVFPIQHEQQTVAVVALFQANELPVASLWSLDDLHRLQAQLQQSIFCNDETASDETASDPHAAIGIPLAPESLATGPPATEVAPVSLSVLETPSVHVPPEDQRGQGAQNARAMRVAEVVGRNLHETEVAFDVANEMHAYLGEGRVGLAIFRGQSCVVRAISNQQVFDRRSQTVAAIERLATRSAIAQREFWAPEQTDELPPEITSLLDVYFEATDAQSIALLPLIQKLDASNDPNDLAAVVRDRDARPGQVVGVLVIEGLQRPLCRNEIESQWRAVELPVVNAVANARRHNSLFLMPLWKELGHVSNLFRGHHRNKAIGIVALMAAVLVGMIVIPADFKLRCEGVVQPTNRSKVYAQAEGVVDRLLVSDGQWVNKGQVLLTLSNPALSAELADVEGKLRETRQKLKTCRLQRLMGDFKDDEQRLNNVRQCAGYEASLGKTEDQYNLLLEKQAQLQVTSPADGQIVTWDMPQRLAARPVEPGQKLLTIADPKGPWELELKLADKRSGYLRDTAARTNSVSSDTAPAEPHDEGLKTTYVLASNPTQVHQGTIREVARSADVDEDHGNIIRVYVDIGQQPNDSQIRTRPGTEVIAHIHAGRRSIGYCKLYEFFDWAKRMWFKYV